MRAIIAAFSATLFIGVAAAAYATSAPAPAATTAPAVAPAAAPAAITPSTATSPVPGSEFQEPNMKARSGSGGVVTSTLITKAPLPTDFVMGSPDAKLVMVEYASLTCPHCAHFSNSVLPELEKRYINTGKMRYILRQFPLNEPALKGAMLLHCVGAQNKDKYYVFARVLFDAQNKWAFDGNYMSGLETIATVGGMTKEQFNNCLASTEREMDVLRDKKLANDELKVPHTPYIYIGNEVYEGDRAVEPISKFIDAKLAEINK
jgi:protein-disulfide isomerase